MEDLKELELLNQEIEEKCEYMAELSASVEAFMRANDLKEITLPDGQVISLE